MTRKSYVKRTPAYLSNRDRRARLTVDQVREIRAKHNPAHWTLGGYGCVKLAREYRVGVNTIRSIVKRLTWKHA